jgi:hypothetical protein
MARRLTIAEQCVDRQERTDVLDGHQINVVTGRVLLHALDSDERPLCGHDCDQLTPIGQSWSAEYLPHLPRCQRCRRAELGDPDGAKHEAGSTDAPAPATGVDIRSAHGTDSERTAAAALATVLATYDLRRWMFTDVVTVDESIRGAFSHPLTISPGRLTQRPSMALTTFLHEELHWTEEGPGIEGAIAEASQRWPDPPPPPAGCHDAQSTWLHMSICALEYESLSEIIGRTAATAELAQHVVYSWLYEQILANPSWFADYLRRHGLTVPGQPPVPRRYFGDAWWTLLGVNQRRAET